ncbi:hypothetical protein Tco_1256418 [Tanacetum coccineum]
MSKFKLWLNIGSLKASSLGLLGKWWWCFKVEGNSLWVKVIKSIYRDDGGLRDGVIAWIIFEALGVVLSKWIGNYKLCDRFPRFFNFERNEEVCVRDKGCWDHIGLSWILPDNIGMNLHSTLCPHCEEAIETVYHKDDDDEDDDTNQWLDVLEDFIDGVWIFKVFLTKHYTNRRLDDPDFVLDFEEIYILDSKMEFKLEQKFWLVLIVLPSVSEEHCNKGQRMVVLSSVGKIIAQRPLAVSGYTESVHIRKKQVCGSWWVDIEANTAKSQMPMLREFKVHRNYLDNQFDQVVIRYLWNCEMDGFEGSNRGVWVLQWRLERVDPVDEYLMQSFNEFTKWWKEMLATESVHDVKISSCSHLDMRFLACKLFGQIICSTNISSYGASVSYSHCNVKEATKANCNNVIFFVTKSNIAVAKDEGLELLPPWEYAVGTFFLPTSNTKVTAVTWTCDSEQI